MGMSADTENKEADPVAACGLIAVADLLDEWAAGKESWEMETIDINHKEGPDVSPMLQAAYQMAAEELRKYEDRLPPE